MLTTLLQLCKRRRFLAIAAALGLVAFILAYAKSPESFSFLRASLRGFLVGWAVTAWVYSASLFSLMYRADHHRTRTISEEADPSAVLVLVLGVIGAVASLLAIGFELLTDMGPADRNIRFAVVGAALLGSWLMLNMLYAYHYAHMYFRSHQEQRPLQFPDGRSLLPDYMDFLYFSFTVAVAAQTSDISVTASSMRRVVLGHSVLVFFFNVAILGATVNLVTGLLGK